MLSLNELYGYYLLVDEGLPVYNPQYVERYGRFMKFLKQLDSKKGTKTEAYLREAYTNSAESAKFFATYPADLSGKSPRELRVIHANARRSGVCS